jgi:hypothetical protein
MTLKAEMLGPQLNYGENGKMAHKKKLIFHKA